MKIIVLAGGLSTERDVSLVSGAGICKTLLAKGHEVFLLDVFMGFPYDKDKLDEVFTLPGHGLDAAFNIRTEEPDLEAVKASRAACTAARGKMESYRRHSTCSASATRVLVPSAAPWPCTKASAGRFSRNRA